MGSFENFWLKLKFQLRNCKYLANLKCSWHNNSVTSKLKLCACRLPLVVGCCIDPAAGCCTCQASGTPIGRICYFTHFKPPEVPNAFSGLECFACCFSNLIHVFFYLLFAYYEFQFMHEKYRHQSSATKNN